ncbi:MAG: FAD-dependent monooxygenase [Pseudomonadota bacterium]
MDAAIVGGGIGGLTAALCLHHHGFRASVYEQAPAFSDVGAGIQLGPNAMRVLHALGLKEAVLAHASQPKYLVLQSAYSGQQITRLSLFRGESPRWGEPYAHIHRADLVDVLASAACERGIALHLGQAIEPVAADDEADILVIADGMNSQFAGPLFGRPQPEYSGYVAYRALVPPKALASSIPPDVASVWSGRGSHVVTYPLRGGSLINFIGVAEVARPQPAGWSQTVGAGDVLPQFRRYPPQVLSLIRAAQILQPWGLYIQSKTGLDGCWTKGNAALLGDASHAMVPFLAQGAAMAIEDSWVLAASLAVAHTPAEGLKAYEAMRKKRVKRVAEASQRAGELYHLRGLGQRLGAFSALRNAQRMGAADLAPIMDWLYGFDAAA